jgi:hypothetical protein
MCFEAGKHASDYLINSTPSADCRHVSPMIPAALLCSLHSYQSIFVEGKILCSMLFTLRA